MSIFINPLLDNSLIATLPEGWWTPAGDGVLGAYQPKGAASLLDSYNDLSGNGNTLTVNVAPSWSTEVGWTFDTTMGLFTPFPSNPDCSALVAFSNATGTGALFGNGSSAGFGHGFNILPMYVNRIYATHQGYWYRASSGVPSGVVGISAKRVFIDGVYVGTINNNYTYVNTIIGIGCVRNDSGTVSYRISATIKAIIFVENSLSDEDMGIVSAAMAAL